MKIIPLIVSVILSLSAFNLSAQDNDSKIDSQMNEERSKASKNEVQTIKDFSETKRQQDAKAKEAAQLKINKGLKNERTSLGPAQLSKKGEVLNTQNKEAKAVLYINSPNRKSDLTHQLEKLTLGDAFITEKLLSDLSNRRNEIKGIVSDSDYKLLNEVDKEHFLSETMVLELINSIKKQD